MKIITDDKVYHSVKEMFDDMDTRRKSRSYKQIVIDFIRYRIWEHRLKEWFIPYILKGKIIRLYQRITRGWDNSDLWSLDYTFAVWVLKLLKKVEQTDEVKRAILAFDFRVKDDYGFSPYDPIRMYEGLITFLDIYISNDFIKKETDEFIIKRLKEFKETVHGHPTCYYSKEMTPITEGNQLGFDDWKDIINTMIKGFESGNMKDLEIFARYYTHLWD